MNKRKVHWKNNNCPLHLISLPFSKQPANTSFKLLFCIWFWAIDYLIIWSGNNSSLQILSIDYYIMAMQQICTPFMLVDVCVTALQARRKVGICPNRLLSKMEQIEIRNPTPLNFGRNKNKLLSFQIFKPFLRPFASGAWTLFKTFYYIKIQPNLVSTQSTSWIPMPNPLNIGRNEIKILSFQIFKPSYGPLLLVHEPSLKLSILSKFNQLWCQSTCQGCFHLPSSCLVRFLYP